MAVDAGISAGVTAAQNAVVAQNSISRVISYVTGRATSNTYAGEKTVQILSGAGRLVNVCIVVKGTGGIKLYDSSTPTAIPDNSLLFVVKDAADIGITTAGLEVSDGIVAVIGAGVSVNFTYSSAGQ
jgi:hypothetical protein